MTASQRGTPIPRAAGRSVWWSRGSVITVKLGADESGGTMSLAEQRCPAGYETPLHAHHAHDELLLVQSGRADLVYGESVLRADPGDAVYLPKGTPHGFRFPDAPGALWILFEAGLEQGFLEAGVPVETPTGALPTAPPEIRESEVLGTMPEGYHTEVLGPLPGGD